MADKMTTYRIISRNSFGTFAHGPDIKSYAKATKLLAEYRNTVPTNIYTLIEVTKENIMTNKKLLKLVLEFLTSDRWGQWVYMEGQVFEDAHELANLIKAQLGEK